MEMKSKRQERREKMRNQAQRSRLMMIGLIVVGAAFLVLAVVMSQKAWNGWPSCSGSIQYQPFFAWSSNWMMSLQVFPGSV